MVFAIAGASHQTHSAPSPGSARFAQASPAQGITKVNGEIPPGVVAPANITLLLRAPLGGGQELYQYLWSRPVGTRAPIHSHPTGGSTCILKGETTLRIEGIPGARTYRAGQCVFMPQGVVMANFISGTVPASGIDTFILKSGDEAIKLFESGYTHIYQNHL